MPNVDDLRDQARSALASLSLEVAERLAAELLQEFPEDAVALWVMGRVKVRLGQVPDGFRLLERSVQIQPLDADAHIGVAEAFIALGDAAQASLAYQNALKLAPKVYGNYLSFAKMLLAYRLDRDAVVVLEKAIVINPSDGEGRVLMAQALTSLNMGDQCLAHLEVAIADEGSAAMASGMLGYWYQARGQFPQARAHFENSIALEPRQALAYYGLAQGNRLTEGDLPTLTQVAALINDEVVPVDERMYLRYVLGKGYADLGLYEQSWLSYEEANKLAQHVCLADKRFNRGGYAEINDGIIATFNREFFKRNRGVGSGQKLPIFVVGMMRSGTTLVEQILSCHPEVGAAGELDFWLDQGFSVVDLKKKSLDSKQLTRLIQQYTDGLNQVVPGKKFVTDKMPQNFQMLGLIHTAFPKAPIIHIRRNPLDTCISIFTTAYQKSPDFAHDPESIVFAYRQYQRLVEHWRKVLPREQFLEIDYEELTANREPIIRKMLSFCGLEFYESCLHPEQNDRLVITPSLWQVRQPVYRTAVDRWKVYEPWLGAFAKLV